MKELIDNKDYEGIRAALSKDPKLADEGLPFDEANMAKAHPLHRICDGVFAGKYTDQEAVEMAKIFLEFGADVNGGEFVEKQDTPLLAASSLHADEVAILYIENGASIHHQGCFGGTALHWAAWCGRDLVVSRLIREKADLNKLCLDYRSTPLLWAIDGLKREGEKNVYHQIECIRLLVHAGADKFVRDGHGRTALELLDEGDAELIELLS